MSSPGETLHKLRERKPLIHQITNYVVMNENGERDARSRRAAGDGARGRRAWRRWRHSPGALVLNIGSLSQPWIDAMLLAGRAAMPRAHRSCSTRSRRRDQAPQPTPRSASSPRSTSRSCAATRPRSRRSRGSRRRSAASSSICSRRRRCRACARSCAEFGGRRLRDRRCRSRLRRHEDARRRQGRSAARDHHGSGCMSSAITAARRPSPRRWKGGRRTRRLRHRGETAALDARGPAPSNANLYDALYNLTPSCWTNVRISGRVKLHCIVDDVDTAPLPSRAAQPSSNSGQGRTDARRRRGRPVRSPTVSRGERTFVVTTTSKPRSRSTPTATTSGLRLARRSARRRSAIGDPEVSGAGDLLVTLSRWDAVGV